jgi:DNA-binding transcriptional MerR regulator/DNA gyrase inhibitor GyrI
MTDVQRIGDIATQYNVTSRTLRYYEEIGLLSSIRPDNSQYRFYDEKAVQRLEQILFLRKLDLSIKEVKEILYSNDLTLLLASFTHKINSLKKDIEVMENLKSILEEFLKLLKKKGYHPIDSIRLLQQSDLLESSTSKNKKAKNETDMEDLNNMSSQINKLTDADIRLIKLRPMKVAYCRAESTSPETDAWKSMREWVRENKLEDLFITRYFGFNNPNPTEGNPVYGYEVWVTVGDNIEENSNIKIKTFEGGLYAVVNTSGDGDDIPKAWERLNNWVEQSDYCYGEHQWLEEHLIVDEASWNPEKFALDLYYPVKLK